ncbi:MAG: hypothetical protein KJ043_21620 [Anaerolineae bacterium]|nr:hypothetical protein [Anaerolineae bacterium]
MIENRIVGHGEESPHQLLANPFNWRIHPTYQQEALADVLDEVGWVRRIIVNKTTRHIVDGHLRVMEAMKNDEQRVPVAYVELTETEEAAVLATFDPIKELAQKNDQRAQALADRVQARSNALKLMVESLRPPQTVSKNEAKATISKERQAQANAVFALGEFRLILPQAELSEWWEALLTRYEGNRQKAVTHILDVIGLQMEVAHDG